MKTKIRQAVAAALLLFGLFLFAASWRTPPRPAARPNPVTIRASLAQVPLAFEANAGQTNSEVKYLARGSGYTVFLTPSETVLTLKAANNEPVASAVRLQLTGARAPKQISALNRLPGTANYLMGSDPGKWQTNLPTFSELRYQGVYPDIDLFYHGSQRQLEYVFVVAPGGDPRTIGLKFGGVEAMDLDATGDLVLHVAAKEIRFRKPYAYQDVSGLRQEVTARYVLQGNLGAGFQVAAYDKGKPLVIDPVLAYSTYLGGSGNETAQAIAVDAAGSAYVAGYTNSANFPVTPGAFQGANNSDSGLGNPVAYVAKLNPAGNQIVYATYLGGSCTDIAYGIAVNGAGEAYVTGSTGSGINPQTNMPDCSPLHNAFIPFPQFNAFQPYGGANDAFITKLNAAGNGPIFSSFLGGSRFEEGFAVAVDAVGDAYLTGDTISNDFPTTPGAVQPSLGGSINSLDAYVTKVSAIGVRIYSTYLGGGDLERGRGIAVDGSGNAYVTGTTASGSINGCGQIQNPPAFPTTALAFQHDIAPSASSPCSGCCPPNNVQYTPNMSDGFVTKLNPTGTALVYSTYLGGGTAATQFGSAFDEGHAIAVDSSGNAYVTGVTSAANFPTLNAVQPANGGGNDAFVTKLNPAGSALVYSTYLGGGDSDEGNGIAVDALGEAFAGGTSGGGTFPSVDPVPPPGPTPAPCPICPPSPSTPGGFVAKFSASGNPLVYSTGIFATSTGKGVALDPQANAYLTGDTQGGIQTVNAAQPNYGGVGDAYVLKLGPATPPVCFPPPANMISWWPGDDNTTDIVSGNNGTWIGAQAYMAGKVADAFSFNGASYISMGTPASLNITGNQVTIDGWINPAVITNDAVYFGKTRNSFNDYLLIFQFNELTGMIKAGGSESIVGSPFVPPANQWTHIALTYDGSIMKLYANGVVVGSLAKSGNIAGDASEFAIGGRTGNSFDPRHLFFNGKVDEVEVFNRALSDAEIAGIFNAGSAGKCKPGQNLCANVTCSASDQCHVAGVCDPATGMCSNPTAPNGTACNDGNACTQNDTCQAGVCTSGNPVTCTASDQCHTAGTCDPTTGMCSNPAKADGTACDDGNKCTTGDSCQAGGCAGTPVGVDDGNPCTIDSCDPNGKGNGITHTAVANGTSCDDGNACTTGDSCQDGVCRGGPATTCNAPDQCHTNGVCDPATGLCVPPAKADGTACDDGNLCTQNDTCQAGVCTGGNPVTCSASDQCHDAGTCNPATGVCSNPPKANGSACNDGNACTQSDTCQAGVCTGGNPVTCSASDQCHDPGTCDPTTGVCSNPAKADGSACSDGNACTQTDTCQAGTCTGSNPVTCTASDQCHDPGTCDPTTGMCSNPAKADGSACSDGNACTQTDTCQAGTCTGSNPVTCTASDQCHNAGTCDSTTGACSNPAKPNGTVCNDGSACTQTDTCQAGSCVGGNPVVCAASDQCHDVGSCNPSTGVCTNPVKVNGSVCSDGNACTTNDVCQSGTCQGSPLNVDDGNACTTDSCDPSTGQVTHTPIPDCPGLASGGFVIGDRNAVVGTKVNFWGSQWTTKNSLTGGAAPSEFKGFANQPSSNPLVCGGTWKTSPGNSPPPPRTVPSSMTVIVASSVSKSGFVISGNSPRTAVISVDPGYDGNPGHEGTGTVMSVNCQSAPKATKAHRRH